MDNAIAEISELAARHALTIMRLRKALQEICDIDQRTIRHALKVGEEPNATEINLTKMGNIAKAALKE